MREIKFRGLGYDGKWHYGYYAVIPSDGGRGGFILENDEWIEVRSETVGQFTGLHDKNGKEIYEGDIYDCWSEGVHKIGVVTWGVAGFYIKVSLPQVVWYFSGGSEPGEVIGNIYENPELL